ncbi:hypothetical protein D1BOALGB6SA_3474 [Olavius sp. associated proteobacterium Delta 1]|nr:hypothetical protein D1BOALGB6SA_3474 [Olavius sp. associated proteobacterium Delta 1]
MSYVYCHLSRQTQTQQQREAPELILCPPTARGKDWIILTKHLKEKGE